MKNNILFSLFLLSAMGLIAACSTSEPRSENTFDDNPYQSERPADTVRDDSDNYRSLADYLQRIPGINVSGSGAGTTVNIRGASSFMASTEPLYVIDGTAVGTNYSSVNSMLNIRDIDNVRVLKGSDASMYGVRGANGVILITTKR